MKKVIYLLLIAINLLFISSCSNDEPNAESGPITIEFDNVAGANNLQLNTADTPYTNSKGEAYKLTRLAYYIGNIKLKKADGTFFTDPVKPDGSAGYYLIDENDADSQEVTLENVPAGDYTEVIFTIGVDASQITQSAPTGPLDHANGLFWTSDSGYIFMAVEGISPASTETDNVFQYHVGGYKDEAGSDQVNNLKTITLSFGDDVAPVRAQHEPEVHLLFDVNKFFNGAGEEVTFSTNAIRDSPIACEDLAGNLSASFVVDHVHEN